MAKLSSMQINLFSNTFVNSHFFSFCGSSLWKSFKMSHKCQCSLVFIFVTLMKCLGTILCCTLIERLWIAGYIQRPKGVNWIG